MYLMSTTTMVHVRMQNSLKNKATKALSAMGLSISDLVRITLTRVAEEQAVPFEVRVPNSKTVSAMNEARKGRLKSHSSVASLMAELNSDD